MKHILTILVLLSNYSYSQYEQKSFFEDGGVKSIKMLNDSLKVIGIKRFDKKGKLFDSLTFSKNELKDGIQLITSKLENFKDGKPIGDLGLFPISNDNYETISGYVVGNFKGDYLNGKFAVYRSNFYPNTNYIDTSDYLHKVNGFYYPIIKSYEVGKVNKIIGELTFEKGWINEIKVFRKDNIATYRFNNGKFLSFKRTLKGRMVDSLNIKGKIALSNLNYFPIRDELFVHSYAIKIKKNKLEKERYKSSQSNLNNPFHRKYNDQNYRHTLYKHQLKFSNLNNFVSGLLDNF